MLLLDFLTFVWLYDYLFVVYSDSLQESLVLASKRSF